MGIRKTFDEIKGKWKWSGWQICKYYDTEEECDADRDNVWEQHLANLKSFQIASATLDSFR